MGKRRRSSPPSNSTLVPFDAHDRQLAVTSPITVIPRGWGIKRVLRSDGSHYDKYYFEPGTGRKFRSKKEVGRYLNGGEYPSRSTRKLYQRKRVKNSSDRRLSFSDQKEPSCRRMVLSDGKNPRWRKMVVSGGKLLTLNDETRQHHADAPAAPSILPDGWIVEEVTRMHSTWADRYYYEPNTGQKFRSLIAVERYLEENAPLSQTLEKIKENKPLAKIFKLENHRKISSPTKKNILGENEKTSPIVSPPSKVKWLIGSPQGDVWNPFISNTLVPDSVKQQWAKKFMVLMNDDGCDFQSS